MITPGMFISDRYEIIDKVGSGGMADVYKAKCHRLNRYVAIKVLKPEFSSDKNFVSKFRGEAQSVAGLSHPNIVSVYDVGEDEGLYYIVMELVEGITLKRFIERKGRLEIREAVGIAIQIAQGMEAAHDNHIVHRDIKPQNIIISRDGKVKVADFGIAKAATSNTVSQNAIGSVHYLSPEQARGGYSDERSDIYSLGVTLYEMLCGQVPFAGDNSVSVALLHIQSEATPVQVLNPDVPTSVDKIVQKCMQKKPERRYQSASELIKDLKKSMINPDGDYVNIPTAGAVSDSPTREITRDEMSQIKSAAKVSGGEAGFQEAAPVVTRQERAKARKILKEETEELDKVDSRLEKVITILSVVAAIALMVTILYVLGRFFGLFGGDATEGEGEDATPTVTQEANPSDAPSALTPTPGEGELTPTPEGDLPKIYPMPEVTGKSLDKAVADLYALSTDLVIDYSQGEYSESYESGQVIRQEPAVGTLLAANDKVVLVYSYGKETVQVEDVTNKSSDEAVKILTKLEFTVVTEKAFDDFVEAGKVIKTVPMGGALAEKGSTVTIYVSEGKEIKDKEVPSIIGQKEKAAKKALTEAGFVPGTATFVYSDEYKEGVVCGQAIAGGTVKPEGTVVDYTVSMGSYAEPTAEPTEEPTPEPTEEPTPEPTDEPTPEPTEEPTTEPGSEP